MRFEIHNSLWQPVDLDGIKLMRRPLPGRKLTTDPVNESIHSKAGKWLAAKHREVAKQKANNAYVVIDVRRQRALLPKRIVIEIAAILVRDGIIAETLQMLHLPGETTVS